MKRFVTYVSVATLTTFSVFSCNTESDQSDDLKQTPLEFSPIDFDSTNAQPLKFDSLSYRYNHIIIIGKFSFSDKKEDVSKHLNEHYFDLNRIPLDAKKRYSSQLKVFVDTNSYIPFNLPWVSDEKKLYRPVYIINKTNKSQFLHNKDLNIIAAQEAQDSNGHWHIIELYNNDFCGNGYGYIPIDPQEYLLSAVPVYEGTFKTKIRYRVQSKDTILVSNVYTGNINYDQFYFRWNENKPFELKGAAHDIRSKEAKAWFQEGFLGSPIKLKITHR